MLEADEEERREARQLPEDEQGEDVVAQHDAEHRAHEGEQPRVEAASLGVPVEVATRVEDDEGADAGDQRREQQPQTIEVEGQRQAQRRRPRQLDPTRSFGGHSQQFAAEQCRQYRRPGGKHPSAMRIPADQPGRADRQHEGRENEKRHPRDAIPFVPCRRRTSPSASRPTWSRRGNRELQLGVRYKASAVRRSAAGTAGQSDRQASLDAVSVYSMSTGMALSRSASRTSARTGHQS